MGSLGPRRSEALIRAIAGTSCLTIPFWLALITSNLAVAVGQIGIAVALGVALIAALVLVVRHEL